MRASLTYCVLPLCAVMTRSFSILKRGRPQRSATRRWQTPSNDGAAPESTYSADSSVPLLLSQGIFAVYKPLDWTSNDVVSYIRGILERDARARGARPAKVGRARGKNKKNVVRVGHGGTLDPLATGVLVIGVGRGTKELQGFLQGAKGYLAGGELGFETTTLDMAGNVTKNASFCGIERADVQDQLASFTGTIDQIPPIFSAIRKDGKKLYQDAYEGKTAEDLQIEARQVEVHSLELLEFDSPKFSISVQCGGGTYIRSLIRDLGYAVNSVATTTFLERTQQGQFNLDDCLRKEDWSAEGIYAAIDKMNAKRATDKAGAATSATE